MPSLLFELILSIVVYRKCTKNIFGSTQQLSLYKGNKSSIIQLFRFELIMEEFFLVKTRREKKQLLIRCSS